MQEILAFLKYMATSNTINFIIMLIILGFIIKKIDLGKIFENGIEKIKYNIKKSDEEKELSEQHLKQAKKIIDGLPEDLNTLDKNCNEKIEIFKNQITNKTNETITNLNKNIDKMINIDEKKVSNLVTEDTAKDAIIEAEENIIKLLEEKPEYHNKFINNSIIELDKVKL